MLEGFRKRMRDMIEVRIFRFTSMRLRSGWAFGDPSRMVLNTYSVAPGIPTIAHWADWRLTRYGFTGNATRQPRIVFVRGRPDQLSAFFDFFLPRIRPETRFVLITGDCDHTVPVQTDLRYPDFATEGFAEAFESLRTDPRLVHWYVQNLDTRLPKMSPIPLGYIEHGGNALYRKVVDKQRLDRLDDRPLKAICVHRVREGPQWEKRREVTRLVTEHWSSFVDHPENIPEDRFIETLQRYPFVLCVGGGGLDPSPKAWATLLAGSIPIMERNATTAAYEELPVAFVDRWDENCLDPDRMKRWVDELRPRFEDPRLRRDVLTRMSMQTWLGRIREQLAAGERA